MAANLRRSHGLQAVFLSVFLGCIVLTASAVAASNQETTAEPSMVTFTFEGEFMFLAQMEFEVFDSNQNSVLRVNQDENTDDHQLVLAPGQYNVEARANAGPLSIRMDSMEFDSQEYSHVTLTVQYVLVTEVVSVLALVSLALSLLKATRRLFGRPRGELHDQRPGRWRMQDQRPHGELEDQRTPMTPHRDELEDQRPGRWRMQDQRPHGELEDQRTPFVPSASPQEGPPVISHHPTSAPLGGIGEDSLRGSDGDDRIEGGVGADMIEGGLGDDIITELDGPDVVDGVGNDAILGGTKEERQDKEGEINPEDPEDRGGYPGEGIVGKDPLQSYKFDPPYPPCPLCGCLMDERHHGTGAYSDPYCVHHTQAMIEREIERRRHDKSKNCKKKYCKERPSCQGIPTWKDPKGVIDAGGFDFKDIRESGDQFTIPEEWERPEDWEGTSMPGGDLNYYGIGLMCAYNCLTWLHTLAVIYAWKKIIKNPKRGSTKVTAEMITAAKAGYDEERKRNPLRCPNLVPFTILDEAGELLDDALEWSEELIDSINPFK